MPLTLPFPYNDRKWYSQYITLHLDRKAILAVVTSLYLALVSTHIGESQAKSMRLIGGALAQRLYSEGLVLPGSVRESWERAFRIKLDERGRIVRG